LRKKLQDIANGNKHGMKGKKASKHQKQTWKGCWNYMTEISNNYNYMLRALMDKVDNI
jgi:hypothetical protein